MEEIKLTVRAVIPPRDFGLRKLMREYKAYKKALIPKVKQAVREVIKDKNIRVYAQQKWMVDKKLNEYLKNLPLHPMPFHNQSVWILRCANCVVARSTGHLSSPLRESENLPAQEHMAPSLLPRGIKPKGILALSQQRVSCEDCPYKPSQGSFWIHFKTKEGEAVCYLHVPAKYHDLIEKACGEENPVLGQVEVVEDKKYGWVNCHICLRLPKPEPYEPKGWIGVDVGWNKLAVSILATCNPHLRFSNPTIHGKEFKTRIIQLRHLLKEYARKGRAWKKWDYRLKHTIKYAVGVVAEEIVSKARKLKAGVAMEQLTFKSTTKGYIVPRYKLMIAVKTLCEREGVPFKLIPAQYTSITCPKCGYTNEENRNGKRFSCLKCGYKADADIVGAMNIARKAITDTQMEGVMLCD